MLLLILFVSKLAPLGKSLSNECTASGRGLTGHVLCERARIELEAHTLLNSNVHAYNATLMRIDNPARMM